MHQSLHRCTSCPAVGGVPTAPPGAPAAAGPPRPPGAPPPRSTTCWVGRIAPTVQSNFVQQLLEACGPVAEWKPVTEPETGKLKGFGFVTFEEPEGVMQALQVLHDLRVDGQQLAVKCNKVGAGTAGREGVNWCGRCVVVWLQPACLLLAAQLLLQAQRQAVDCTAAQ